MFERSGIKAMLGMVSLLATIWTTAAMADAAIYKWVDKNGGVHFTQTPPPKERAQQVKPDYATPSIQESAPGEEAPAKEKEPAAKEDNGKVTVFNKAQAKKACAAARKQLKLLRDSKNQLMVQDKDGKYHSMSKEELQRRIKKVEEIENKACVD